MRLIGKSLVMRTRAATEGTAVRLRMNGGLGFSVLRFAFGPFSRWEKVDPERSERDG